MDIDRRQFLLGGLAAMAVLGCSSSDERLVGSIVGVAGTDVFYLDRVPSESSAPAVLFLHGASFNADVWARVGILDEVAARGSRAVAVDLPGFGLTPSIETDRGEFLAQLIDQLFGNTDVVVVSPSMSGTFSLPLIASRGGDSMSGFVPIAPVGILEFVATVQAPITDLPALVVWGSNDDVVDVALADDLLRAVPTGELLIIDDAGHAAFEDEPAAFVEALTTFLRTLPQPEL